MMVNSDYSYFFKKFTNYSKNMYNIVGIIKLCNILKCTCMIIFIRYVKFKNYFFYCLVVFTKL